jgi:hypothetical protein
MADRPTRREAEFPKTEMEITPEMIEAGVGILVEMYDALGSNLDRITAARIFEAMAAKKVVGPSELSSTEVL